MNNHQKTYIGVGVTVVFIVGLFWEDEAGWRGLVPLTVGYVYALITFINMNLPSIVQYTSGQKQLATDIERLKSMGMFFFECACYGALINFFATLFLVIYWGIRSIVTT